MTSRFRLDRGNEQTQRLVAWAAEQIERDRAELERPGTDPDRSNHLRGRLSVWREIQQLAEPLREAKIDGRPV